MSDLDPKDIEIRARLGLQAAGAQTHPAGEALVAFEEDPASLTEGARAWIEKHVASCAACREALAAVPALGPAMEARPAAARFARPMLMAAGWILAAILVRAAAHDPAAEDEAGPREPDRHALAGPR